jgi:hypothetical protein
MKSSKWWTLLPAALIALALALPAMASASRVELSPGKLAPAGTRISIAGSNIQIKDTALGVLPCKSWSLEEVLTENSGGVVNAIPGTAGTAAGCWNGTKPLIISDIKWNQFHTSLSGSGTVNMSFTLQLGQEVVCHFTTSAVPFAYSPGGFVVQFSGAESLHSSPAACGTAKFSGEFAMSISGGSHLVLA